MAQARPPAAMTEPVGKVVVVGGSGNLGRRAAAEAVRSAEAVVVAGADAARAAAVASWLGPRAEGVAVDVTDRHRLHAALAGADVVLNAAAPFFRLGTAVLDAAIDVGCAYADVCDDWEATVAMLDRHEDAVAAGVIAVTGFGIAPGVDDALAHLAMRPLDRVHHLWTGWTLSALSADGSRQDPPDAGASSWPGTPRALIHLLQCCVGPIRVLDRGRLVDVEPLRRETVPHPRLGPLEAFTIGSPEAVTLGRGRPELQSNVNVMMATPDVAADLRSLASAVRSGDIDLDDAASLLLTAADSRPEPGVTPPDPPSVFAVVTGSSDGEPRTVAADLDRSIPGGANAAGALLGAFPRLVAEGVVSGAGVRPLAEAVSPDRYLSLVGERHDPPRAADDLVTVTGRSRPDPATH